MRSYERNFALGMLVYSVLLILYQAAPPVGVSVLTAVLVFGVIKLHRRLLKRGFSASHEHVERHS